MKRFLRLLVIVVMLASPGKQLSAEEAGRDLNVGVQSALQYLGYYRGAADGVLGPESITAIKRFQSSIGKKPTGELSEAERYFLFGRYYLQAARKADLGIDNTATSVASTAASQTAEAATPASTDTATTASSSSGEIYASRLFVGPEDYPPESFAAYGILAFRAEASDFDRERHIMICKAYLNSIRPFEAIGKPSEEQMVTVWPVKDRSIAQGLSRAANARACSVAVANYGSLTADRALRHAAAAGVDLQGIGPFLLAWSPAKKKGATDAIVLVADLSEIVTYDEALTAMLAWVQDIERDPQLWTSGWTVEALRSKAQKWFDHHGTQLLLGSKPIDHVDLLRQIRFKIPNQWIGGFNGSLVLAVGRAMGGH
jgi:hypothetical protein